MRKYIAEFLGTALLVFVGTGAVMFSNTDSIGFSALGIALAFGFAIMAAIYAFGDVSGGHFNPAVSFAMAINKRLSWNNFFGYVISQILGAILGSAMVLVMAFPYVKTSKFMENANSIMNSQNVNADSIKVMGKHGFLSEVGIGANDFQSKDWMWVLLIEAVLTFFAVLVIMNLTSSKFTDNRLVGLVIALTFTALIFIGGPITGGSLNPARSIGPALFQGGKTLLHVLVYIAGPMIGAGIAAVTAKYLMLTESKVATASASASKTTSRARKTTRK